MMHMRSQVLRMCSSSNNVQELRMRTTWLCMRIINLDELFWKFGTKLAKKLNLYLLIPITKT